MQRALKPWFRHRQQIAFLLNALFMEDRITGDINSFVQLQTPHWYAVYTRSRSEKSLQLQLSLRGIDAYVPLKKVLHQWSDRKRFVEEPVIRSYCFVKVSNKDYYEVLNTPGAIRYIWFSGKPAIIPERQIEILKAITGSDVEVECLPDTFHPGVHVKVTAGPLKDLVGELVNISNKKKVIVRIDHLNQVITLSISPMLIEVAK
jgi:transcriptional antiterminator RfaH